MLDKQRVLMVADAVEQWPEEYDATDPTTLPYVIVETFKDDPDNDPGESSFLVSAQLLLLTEEQIFALADPEDYNTLFGAYKDRFTRENVVRCLRLLAETGEVNWAQILIGDETPRWLQPPDDPSVQAHKVIDLSDFTEKELKRYNLCLLYTSPSPRDS